MQVPDFIDVEMYITDMSASSNKTTDHSGYSGEQSFGDFDVVTFAFTGAFWSRSIW